MTADPSFDHSTMASVPSLRVKFMHKFYGIQIWKLGFDSDQLVAAVEKELQIRTFGLTVHEDRSWSKALAYYSTATDGWPRGVSVNASRGRATEKKEWGGPRTLNM